MEAITYRKILSECGKTLTDKSLFINDGVRLGQVEKSTRAAIMTPIFFLALAGIILHKEGFSHQFLLLAKKMWTVRNSINILLLIPVASQFYRGEGINRKNVAQTGENIARLVMRVCLFALFVSSFHPNKLGKATIPVAAAALGFRGYLTTSIFARKGLQDFRSRETLKAGLAWGWFAGAVLESPLPVLHNTIGAGASALGLADHGFGVVHTGFGAASALAGLFV